jgi:DnaJ family protein C protein 7
MVLPKLFSKKPTRKPLNTKDKERNRAKDKDQTASSSSAAAAAGTDPRSPDSSPEKRVASPVPSSKRSSHDRDRSAHSKSSLSPTKSNRSSAQYSQHTRYDPESHPLNLPPELRRLSALSAMATNEYPSKEVDMDRQQTSSPPAAVSSSAPTTPSANGHVNSPFAPEVPPHRVPTGPSPVVQTPVQKSQAPPPESKPQIDSEAHKAAGNKFFKAKEYAKAIEEYSKGTEATQSPRWKMC